jgi:multicomponent Na+:H+ antiporter subunit C
MSRDLWFALVGALLFALALSAFLMHANILRRLLAFNIMGTGCFLVLVGLSQNARGPDPVPHALVLTRIVVAVAATALALILLRRWFASTGSITLPEDSTT